MNILRTIVVAASLMWISVSASAQLGFPGYLPKACEGAAKNAIPGATDGKIVGILAVGIEVPLGNQGIFLGMNLDNGTAPMWVYLVQSQQLDTIAGVPLIRILNSCSAPPIDAPTDLIPVEDFGQLEIPSNYLQGTELTGKIKANGDYVKFEAANPDSQPTVTFITTSTEEFMDFPIGTPFWSFVWLPADGAGIPFTCLVHATNGTTMCFGEDIMSVATDALEAGFSVAPNPSRESAVVNIPTSWIGSSVTVDAVSTTGEIVNLVNGGTVVSPQVFINTSSLASGMWSLRISNAHHIQTLPLSVIH